MFARYIGEPGFGLLTGEVYYINIHESLIQENRKLTITVGDYWAGDYSSYGEAMMEWVFEIWTYHEDKLKNRSPYFQNGNSWPSNPHQV